MSSFLAPAEASAAVLVVPVDQADLADLAVSDMVRADLDAALADSLADLMVQVASVTDLAVSATGLMVLVVQAVSATDQAVSDMVRADLAEVAL
jgi:hypothetical protein